MLLPPSFALVENWPARMVLQELCRVGAGGLVYLGASGGRRASRVSVGPGQSLVLLKVPYEIGCMRWQPYIGANLPSPMKT